MERCPWCGEDELYIKYHDDEWGIGLNRLVRVIITFIISFIITYLIFGYVINHTFIQIHWDESATAWDKFREYYIRTAKIDAIPAFILSIISTILINPRKETI